MPFADQLKWQEMRDHELWVPSVNELVDLNLKSFRKVFDKYCFHSRFYP